MASKKVFYILIFFGAALCKNDKSKDFFEKVKKPHNGY